LLTIIQTACRHFIAKGRREKKKGKKKKSEGERERKGHTSPTTSPAAGKGEREKKKRESRRGEGVPSLFRFEERERWQKEQKAPMEKKEETRHSPSLQHRQQALKRGEKRSRGRGEYLYPSAQKREKQKREQDSAFICCPFLPGRIRGREEEKRKGRENRSLPYGSFNRCLRRETERKERGG